MVSHATTFRNIFSRHFTEKHRLIVKSKGMFSTGAIPEGGGEDMCSHARAAAAKRKAQYVPALVCFSFFCRGILKLKLEFN